MSQKFNLLIIKLIIISKRLPVIGSFIWRISYASNIWKGIIVNKKIINGLRMRLRIDDWVQKKIYINGYYELNETNKWQEIVKGKKCIMDIGGNVGYYSILASPLIAINGKIFLFEPVAENIEFITHNLSLNKISNIQIERKIVSDEVGLGEIHVGESENLGMSSLYDHKHISGKIEKIEKIDIDTFVEKNGIDSIDAVKIDVEGHELSVLKGMKKSLINFKPIVMIEVLDETLKRSGNTSKCIFDFFNSVEYDSYDFDSNGTLRKIHYPYPKDGLLLFKPKTILS